MEIPQQPNRRSRLASAWIWLAGTVACFIVAAGLLNSYRHRAELARGRAEWDAEVARVREAGDPLSEAELEAYYKVPDGEEDLTALYHKAVAGCRSDSKAAGNLPIVGLGPDEIPVPPEAWQQLQQAETFLEPYRESLDELVVLGKRRGAMRIDTDDIQQLQDLRSAIRLLQLQMAVQSHRQDHVGAADSLIALHRMVHALRYEPAGNAQLFRVAFSRLASWQVVPLVRDPSFPTTELRRLLETFVPSDWQHALFLSVSLSDRITTSCCTSQSASLSLAT